MNGYGIAYFKVSDSTPIDAEATVTLEVRPARQKTLSSACSVIAVKPADNSNPSKQGKNSIPNINPRYVQESDALYKEEHWTNESVAKVSEDQESIDIWVSSANKHLVRLVERAMKQSDSAVESVKSLYLEHIAFYAYMSHRQKETKALVSGDDGEGISDVMFNRIKESDLKHACETVCGIINDLFDYVTIAASEGQEL